MSLETGLLDLLKANSSIKSIIGSHFRTEWRDQNSKKPAVVITRISGGKDSALDMSNHFNTARIQIDCFADSYEKTKTLAELVKGVLHGYKGPASTYQVETLQLDNEIDLGETIGDRIDRRVALDFFVLYL